MSTLLGFTNVKNAQFHLQLEKIDRLCDVLVFSGGGDTEDDLNTMVTKE